MLFKQSPNADANVVRGLRDEDYGSRGCTVTDPEGNVWTFGKYRREWPAPAACPQVATVLDS